MKLYVCMVLSGSICTLLYIVFNRFFTCEMSLKWRKLFLRVNILLYLLPVPWIAAQMRTCAKWLLEKAGMVFPGDSRSYTVNMDDVWESFLVLNENRKIFYITGYRKWLWLIAGASILYFLLTAGWMFLYWRISRQYRNSAERTDNKQCIKSKKSRRNVRIGYSSSTASPITVGVIRPMILLPSDREQYSESIEEIVLHELKHISCMDVLWRFLTFMVIAMEWFNPLVYYLFKENIAVSEMVCDEAAVEGRTKAQKADYIRCMIAASEKSHHSKIITVSFGTSRSLLEEGMRRIMGKNTKKIRKGKAAGLITLVCCLAVSVPVFAYKLPASITEMDVSENDPGWDNTDIFAFTREGDINDFEPEIMRFDQTDAVFINEAGVVYYENVI